MMRGRKSTRSSRRRQLHQLLRSPHYRPLRIRDRWRGAHDIWCRNSKRSSSNKSNRSNSKRSSSNSTNNSTNNNSTNNNSTNNNSSNNNSSNNNSNNRNNRSKRSSNSSNSNSQSSAHRSSNSIKLKRVGVSGSNPRPTNSEGFCDTMLL